ncbi:hypothetical protein E4U39_001544 [Claviceps sp. Clav50 group G5]|nr:hypothetical protein E4U39_001544 [Claviceps sp. Clav50 group G5]
MNSLGKERPFRPATVGKCYAQTATDRFGHEAKRAILDRELVSFSLGPLGDEEPILHWPPSGSEDGAYDDVPATSIYKLVPSMVPHRNNLTALSQKYNLYFTAYRSTIYVYVPRSVPRQTIPRHADAQIRINISHVGLKIPGYASLNKPTMINQLVVGALGHEETVATCHDNGEVTAFYTKEIAEYIRDRSNTSPTNATATTKTTPREGRNSSPPAPSRRKKPRPFFQENVGMSAWGLAIHKQSRLIAVSSARYEITVFAPALKPLKPQTQTCDCDSCCQDVEDRVRRRVRNWRIVVTLGVEANNIHNISFVDDEHGNADKISAIDYNGSMWLADIWKPKQAAICVPPSPSPLLYSSVYHNQPSHGWGILALANTCFLTVHSEKELLGARLEDLGLLDKAEAIWHPTLNLYEYNRNLPDNPCARPLISAAAADAGDYGASTNLMDQNGHDDNGANYDGDDDEEYDEEWDIYEYDEAGVNIDPDVGGVGHSEIFESDNDEDNDSQEQAEEEEEYNDDDDDDEPSLSNASGNALLESDEFSDSTTDESISISNMVPPPSNDGQAKRLNILALTNRFLVSDEVMAALKDLWAKHLTIVKSSHSLCESIHREDRDQSSFEQCSKDTLTHGTFIHLDMAYIPHIGRVCATPTVDRDLLRYLQRPIEFNRIGEGRGLAKLTNRYHIIRMYEEGFEMHPLGSKKGDPKRLPEYGMLCPLAFRMGDWSGGDDRPHFHDTNRLCMVLHIPELFLIVIGSAVGRVMLITPTRLAHPIEKADGVLHHGLRLEWVLPRKSDEAVFRTRKRPLHGMAVGPVQTDGVMDHGLGKQRGWAEAAAMPRRYRLMLHYRNHDILTYELSREEQTGKVCIF